MAFRGKEIRNPKAKMTIKFLQTSVDTGGQLLEMLATYQANSAKPVKHYHPFQDEVFKVISGELTVNINGSTKILKAGEELNIFKNTVHSMWNASKTPAIVNWQVRPAMTTEYFLETVAGIATHGKTNKNGTPPLLQSAIMANKYTNVFRLPNPPFLVQKILFTLLSPIALLRGYRPDYEKYLD